MKKMVAALVSLGMVAAPAQAGPLRFDAVPQDGVSTVKWLGATKMMQQRALGRVSVVPRGLEGGKLAFDVEVHNFSDRAAFFGHDSVEVSTADQTLTLATGKIDSDARKKAMWTKVGVTVAMIALLGVATALSGSPAAAQNFYSPPAPRRAAAPPPPPLPGEGAVPESTSVPSRHLYSGRIFVERPKGALRGRELNLSVNFNGEQYPFAYRLSES
jgi:hypothetical protein